MTTIADIQQATAQFYGIFLADLLSAKRNREWSWPRQVAMHLSRELTSRSFPQIAQQFGRDHSTVQHACAVVPKRPGLLIDALAIKESLSSPDDTP